MVRHTLKLIALFILLFVSACTTPQRREELPVVLPSPTRSPEPLATLTTPATRTVAPTPSVVPASATAAPPTVTATPLPVTRAAPAAVDEAADLLPDAWSPSGRYVSYLVPAEGGGVVGPTEPVELRIYDSERELVCAVPTEGNIGFFMANYLWLEGDRFLFHQGEQGIAMWAQPCEGEPRLLVDAPRNFAVIAGNETRSRWLLRGEAEPLILLDGQSLAFTPVEGVNYGLHPSVGWSPNGEHLVYAQEGEAYEIDQQTGVAARFATWEMFTTVAGTENFLSPPPQWLDDQRFLIPSMRLSAPQLISLDGTTQDVIADLFGLPRWTPEARPRVAALIQPDDAAWYLLLTEYREGGGADYRLYRSETNEVQPLSLPEGDAAFQFVAVVDQQELVFFSQGDSEAVSYWVRPLDGGPDSWSELPAGYRRVTVSPDGRYLAINEADGVRVYDDAETLVAEWKVAAETLWLLWSPQSDRLLVVRFIEPMQYTLYLLDLAAP